MDSVNLQLLVQVIDRYFECFYDVQFIFCIHEHIHTYMFIYFDIFENKKKKACYILSLSLTLSLSLYIYMYIYIIINNICIYVCILIRI